MPDNSIRTIIRTPPPPAPLIPRSAGGWLWPLGKAALTALAAGGRQLVHASHSTRPW